MTRTELILKNKWLVYTVLKRIPHDKNEYEDMFSVGMIGLIKAVDGFDETRRVKFSTYAAKCIENEMRIYNRKVKRKEMLFSQEEMQATLSSEIMTQTDLLEEKEILREALKKLKKRERMLLDMQFGLTGTSCSQKEIAEFFGVSQSTISREKIRILLRLRKAFGD